MNKTTAEVIMLVKGNHTFARKNYYRYEDLQMYYADRCDCYDVSDYDPPCLMMIVKSIVLDYSKTCTNPTELLRLYFEAREYLYSYLHFDNSETANKIRWDPILIEVEAWLKALVGVKVREGNNYINGFTEEFCHEVIPTEKKI